MYPSLVSSYFVNLCFLFSWADYLIFIIIIIILIFIIFWKNQFLASFIILLFFSFPTHSLLLLPLWIHSLSFSLAYFVVLLVFWVRCLFHLFSFFLVSPFILTDRWGGENPQSSPNRHCGSWLLLPYCQCSGKTHTCQIAAGAGMRREDPGEANSQE